jgi:hypothetical protein
MHPKMYVINDLAVQHDLLDRRRVYEILKDHGIQVLTNTGR